MNGLHIVADFYQCANSERAMQSARALQSLCVGICADNGLEVVSQCFHQFGTLAEPAGATGAVVLAESHLAIHTWPELGSVTLDLYVCNFSRDNRARAEAVYAELLASFAPAKVERQTLQRGQHR